MARMQRHHITYQPEWIVDLNMLMHRTISRVQITKATPEAYAGVTNFAHAVCYEWNRMRQELDVGGGVDLRQHKPKDMKGKKKKGKRKIQKAVKKPDSFSKKKLKKAMRKIKRRS